MSDRSLFLRLGALCLLVAGLSLLLSSGLPAQAAPGDLDTSFGNGGQVTQNWIVPYSGTLQTLVRQPDGNIVAAGAARINQDDDFVLARFSPDGVLDAGFGAGGTLTTDFGHGDRATALAMQADGKILAGGHSDSVAGGHSSFALARYNADGSLDTSFGENGLVVTAVLTSGGISTVAVQPDNKIVVVGWAYRRPASGLYNEHYLALARYNPDGGLDPSFGAGGVRLISESNLFGQPRGLALLPDGRIVVAATVQSSCADEFCGSFLLMRLLADGLLDPSFGSGGRVTTPFSSRAEVSDMVLLPDARILIGGHTGTGMFAVARYTSGGALDATFGSNGLALVDFTPGADVLRDMALEPGGKILLAGEDLNEGGYRLARLDSSGRLDPGFGSGGKEIVPSFYGAIALVILGGENPKFIVGAEQFEVARFQNNGALDPGFGVQGKLVISINGAAHDTGRGVAVQPDGKILVAGTSGSWEYGRATLVRYNADGTRDNSFGDRGAALITLNLGGQNRPARATALALQPDGKIVVAGQVFTPSLNIGFAYDFVVLRLNPDGRLDPSFGNGGVIATDVDHLDESLAIAVQSDGRIVVGGGTGRVYRVGLYWTRALALLRYNPDGSLDAGFGEGGIVADTDRDEDNTAITGVDLQEDGKIVAAVQTKRHEQHFKVLRFNSDGASDSSFGQDGETTIVFPDTGCGTARAVRVQQDGKLVAAGLAGNCDPSSGWTTFAQANFALARLNHDGSLDGGFAQGGRLLVDFPGATEWANALLVQPNGKLLAAGKGADQFAFVRTNPDGSLDSSFGANGKAVIAVGSAGEVHGLALQADGKIIGAGVGIIDRSEDFAVVRLQNPEPVATPTIGPGCIFSDVCQSDYFFGSVEYLVGRGAISGYGDNTFRPYNDMTRGQLAKVVVLAEGWKIQTEGGPHFSDVPVDNPFYQYVETAYARGIVSGYEDGTFRWSGQVTRGQLSKIIALAAEWTLVSPAEPHFADVGATNPFYSYIETLHAHGAISGYADGTFRWGNPATRGQLAKIVHLALGGTAQPLDLKAR